MDFVNKADWDFWYVPQVSRDNTGRQITGPFKVELLAKRDVTVVEARVEEAVAMREFELVRTRVEEVACSPDPRVVNG